MKRRNFLKITLPLTVLGKAGAAPSDLPELTFGVIADPQYADADPRGSRYYRNSLQKLEGAVADLNTKSLKFTTTLGDLIDKDFKSFSAVMPIYAKLKAPHFPVCGNHDFSVADADKDKVLGAMGLEKAHYSKVFKNWRFIFLDGAEIGVWRHPTADPRNAQAKAMKDELAKKHGRRMGHSSAAISAEQLKWLQAELTAAKKSDQRVIIFNHYPVLPAKDGYNQWNADEIVALIGKYDNVAAYMNGHKHSGNYTKSGDCHYVNLKGMVETEAKTAYATVRCFSDRIEIEGMGLEPARNLDA